jgi:hypothetical protein
VQHPDEIGGELALCSLDDDDDDDDDDRAHQGILQTYHITTQVASAYVWPRLLSHSHCPSTRAVQHPDEIREPALCRLDDNGALN